MGRIICHEALERAALKTFAPPYKPHFTAYLSVFGIEMLLLKMWGLFFLLIVQSQAQADYRSMTNAMKERLVEKPKKDNGKNFI